MDLAPSAAWIATSMLLAQVPLGLFRVRGFLRGSHIILGAILLPVTFVHARLSMKTVFMKSANLVGLWLATAALLLLGVRLLLGTTLIRPFQSSSSLTRVHLAVGLGILSLASVHTLLIRN
jgi:hypothetical protein